MTKPNDRSRKVVILQQLAHVMGNNKVRETYTSFF